MKEEKDELFVKVDVLSYVRTRENGRSVGVVRFKCPSTNTYPGDDECIARLAVLSGDIGPEGKIATPVICGQCGMNEMVRLATWPGGKNPFEVKSKKRRNER